MGEKGVDGLIAYQQAVLFAGRVIRITPVIRFAEASVDVRSTMPRGSVRTQ